MNLKIQPLGFLNETPKGIRGLSGIVAALDMAKLLPVIEKVFKFEGEKLKSGEEVPVVVPVPGLPLNANIKKLAAAIEIQKDDTAEKASFKQESVIEEAGGPKRTFKVDIAMPELPRNISVRLDGGEVFWSFADAAVQGAYELPDFVEHVNTYLDKLPAESQEVILKFLLKADGPGEVKITIRDMEYSVIQTQSWINSLDDTIRLDRTFQLDFGSIERVPLDAFADGEALSLSEIKIDIGGEFEPERLLGPVEAQDGREFATISGDYALAQSIKFGKSLSGKAIRCVGVAGPFQVDADAELYVETQSDAAGSPSAGAPLAKSNLTLVAAEAGDSKPWSFARFEGPVDLNPDTPYWVVIKGIRGKARLGLKWQAEEYLQQILFNRGGQMWKSFSRASGPASAAMLRLVYLPGIDNQTAAIEIGLEGTQASERLNPGQQTQTISLDVPARMKQAVLVIKSHARGTLSIANVIQEYSPAGATNVFKLQTARPALEE